MEYYKYDLENYKVHFIKTNKFKTVTININFKTKLEKNSMLKRYLLGNLLPFSSNKYRTEREIQIQSEELFDMGLNIETKKSGYYHIFSIKSTFINEKYTEPNYNKKSIEFIKEIIFNPYIVSDEFYQKHFENAKRFVLEDLETIKEDPSAYSKIMMRNIIGNELYSLNPFTLINEIKNITSKELYETYKNMLSNDIVDVFIIGDLTDEEIDLLKDFPVKNKVKDNHIHMVDNNSNREEIKKEIIKYPSNQSKLELAFTMENLTEFERKYVISLYSFILGGSGDSKLFQNVREKNSLCYYISSSYNNLYNIFEITSGINSKDYDKTLELIYKEIENMKCGNIEEEEIEKGKITYINACEEIYDSPNSILNIYISKEYLNNDLIEDKIKNIKLITKDDIVNLAQKIKLNTVFMLKGEEENEKD